MKNRSVTKGRGEETLGRKSKCMEVEFEKVIKGGCEIKHSVKDAKNFISSLQPKKEIETLLKRFVRKIYEHESRIRY